MATGERTTYSDPKRNKPVMAGSKKPRPPKKGKKGKKAC